MFCTDIIAQDIWNWQDGSTIFISAPTGSGKTTFILKALLPMALRQGREILYLSNRQLLHRQLIKQTCEIFDIPYGDMQDEKIAEFPGITFMTYQTLQEHLQDAWILNRNPFYFYVVFDEVHYFAEDSAFNPQIGRLLEWLPKMRKNTMIAISATIDSALPYLGFYTGGWQEYREEEHKTIYWREPQELSHRLFGRPEFLYFYIIEAEIPRYSIVVYQTIQDIVEEINKDKTGEKWVVFQSNKERAGKELARKIKKTYTFLTADNKEDEKMQEIIEEQKFSSDVLVTTKVLDNGVSLHDRRIKKIVLDTTSKTEFLQMLGRRRRCEGEREPLTLYIPQKSAKYFAGWLNKYVMPALEVINTPPETLIKQLLKLNEVYQIVHRYYDVRKNKLLLNPVAEDILLAEKRFCERMMNALKEDENAFVKEQLSWLNREEGQSSICYLNKEKKGQEMKQLSEYLEQYEGQGMDKKEQKEFREKMRDMLHAILPSQFPSKSRRPCFNKINASLKCLEVPWEIQRISGKKKGEETIWILQQKK